MAENGGRGICGEGKRERERLAGGLVGWIERRGWGGVVFVYLRRQTLHLLYISVYIYIYIYIYMYMCSLES